MLSQPSNFAETSWTMINEARYLTYYASITQPDLALTLADLAADRLAMASSLLISEHETMLRKTL